MTLVFCFQALRAAQAAAQLARLANGRIQQGRLLQMLYLADRKALIDTGVPITSAAIVNTAAGPALVGVDDSSVWRECFSSEGGDFRLVVDPGDGELSEYDVETLGAIYDGGDTWDLRRLPEWKDPAPSTSQVLLPNEILVADGVEPERIQAFEDANEAVRQLRDSIRDPPDARRS